MKKLLFVIGVATCAALIAILVLGRGGFRAGSKLPESAAQATSAPTVLPNGMKAVGVAAVYQDPTSYAGPVAIEGIVHEVFPSRGAFILIDVREFETCGLVCPNEKVPVFAPSDEFNGQMPAVKDHLVAIGDLRTKGQGFEFTAREILREGKPLLTRVNAPSAQSVPTLDLMPATLLEKKKELGLTRKQVARLKEIQTQYLKAESEWQGKINHCQAEIVELLEKKSDNQAKIDHEKKEIEEFKEQLAKERKKAEDAARAVLTPAQLKKLSGETQQRKA